MVGTNVGGIPLQVQDGVPGYPVEGAEQCAERMLDLLRDPAGAEAMGARGREEVRAKFVAPVQLRNDLDLFNRLRVDA